jgi:hypothetical protein
LRPGPETGSVRTGCAMDVVGASDVTGMVDVLDILGMFGTPGIVTGRLRPGNSGKEGLAFFREVRGGR